MLRTDWLNAQLTRWTSYLDTTDIQAVEVQLYHAWMQEPIEVLIENLLHSSVPLPEPPLKRDIVNSLMEIFMESMYSYIEDLYELQRFPEHWSGKIVMAINILSRTRVLDARYLLMKWSRMVNAMIARGKLVDSDQADWEFAMDVIGSIYFDCVVDNAIRNNLVQDLRKNDIYKKYESRYTFEALFVKVQDTDPPRQDTDPPRQDTDPPRQDTDENVCCICLDVPDEWCHLKCGHGLCSACLPAHCISSISFPHITPAKCPLCRDFIREISTKGESYIFYI